MSRESFHTRASWHRCLAVWIVSTCMCFLTAVACAGVAKEAMSGSGGRRSLEDVLVAAAGLVGTACLLWLWVVASVTVVEAVRGGAGRPRTGTGRLPGAAAGRAPSLVRRLVLAACGVAVTVSVAAPGHAEVVPPVPDSRLAGLPFPDRAATTVEPDRVDVPASAPRPTARPVALRRPTSGRHVVHRGDTLWEIAAASLPDGASAARVDERWREIHRLNRTVIGADPHLIRPGQQLVLPTDEGDES